MAGRRPPWAHPRCGVYWPRRVRAGADPPNWRRPGLTLYGDGGTPELALSETPALNGNPDSRRAYVDGMVATYAVLASVEEGSAAADAGLRRGDVIVEAGGRPVAAVEDLYSVLRQRDPGDELEVAFMRDGDRDEATVTLADRP